MLQVSKTLDASQNPMKSCGFRAGAAKVYFLYYTCTEKLRLLRRICQVYFLYYTCTEKLRLLRRICQVYFLYYTCTEKLRLLRRICQVYFLYYTCTALRKLLVSESVSLPTTREACANCWSRLSVSGCGRCVLTVRG